MDARKLVIWFMTHVYRGAARANPLLTAYATGVLPETIQGLGDPDQLQRDINVTFPTKGV